MKHVKLLLSLALITYLSSCVKEVKENNPGTANTEVAATIEYQYVPNQLLVKFKNTATQRSQSSALARVSGNVSQQLLTRAMESSGDKQGIYLVNTSLEVTEAINELKQAPDVLYAEPNYIYTHDAVSNDPYVTNNTLWGMNGTYGCNAATAWAAGHTGSANVYVGIIDEGAQYNHVDLNGNFGNPKEIAGDGIDNDGNGKVDDAYGWDFDGNNNSTYDGTGDDHGTHVSGTIGGIGGNGIGVAGVNWNVKLISAKFLGASGGTTANAILAVDYITDLKTRDGLNIVATNNSWGGGGFSQGLMDAIERANQKGILFIVAAGNGNQAGKGINIDSKPSYPAAYTNANIISVAAIDKTGAIASFSNYGAKSVDLGAPGVAITSTLPPDTYGSYSGTSMATPHVTGAAALYAATNNLAPKTAADAAVIKTAILNSGTPTSSLSGKTVTGKRLNVATF